MTPLAGFFGLGPQELLIILAVVLLLFGGSRLAGLGKSTGRALKEFKEETKGLMGDKKDDAELADSKPAADATKPVDGEWEDVPAKSTVQDPASADVRKDV